MTSPAQQLHRAAMSAASEAQAAYLAGDTARWQQLSRQALDQERQAAWLLREKLEAEPTRSLLFRGAAQLAFNCGEFREAERLIAEAQLGNAPEEIRVGLRELSRQVSNALEFELSMENLPAPEYVEQLRAQALHILVAPRDLKYLTTVSIDVIIEVLRKLKDSFLNFIEIDFWKNFSPSDFREPETLIANLRRDANPRLVNLKYSSFAASISSDLVVMSRQYSQEINDWKRTAFVRYKTEIFETANYESEAAAEILAKPYSPSERRRIFQPVVDLFKESNSFSFAVSDPLFLEKKKVYKPVGKRVRSILLPELAADDLKKEQSLFQILGIGEAEAGKGKLSEVSRQEVDSANWTATLAHLKYEKEELYLSEPLEVAIRYDKPMFYLEFSPLQLSFGAGDYSDLMKEFQRRVILLHSNLTKRPTAELSADETEMLDFFKRTVFSKGK